ncbi:MAG: T9SS type A sorting domain-containing protein [Aliifodinibius sp.]|nr:T9SS type A sorting domain-containing protein [Fodinibius sp.]NIW44253.1 T9SS type A sorting domain-containing protein [Gammaproteobacteria bacterium]NIX01511.1 T9SS type A sorting domain-containing protein [Phycisphaerae bacterium]NIY26037.1 T9SS type A sorting domain-containing protein [Fodinibius sp.]
MSKFYNFLIGVFVIAVLTVGLHAQVPNGGFEQWTGGNPNNWATSNFPGFGTPITQSSNSHSGSSAARGEVVNVLGSPWPPFLSTADSNGFPVSQRYAELTGFYQFSPQGNDRMEILVGMLHNQQGIGGGVGALPPAGSYTSFSLPIQYVSGDVPDHCFIYIFAGDTANGTIGTFFLLDDLALSGISDIDLVLDPTLPSEFTLEQNYPNPFNPATTIVFSLPIAAEVSLVIYNAAGQLVERLVDHRSMTPGSYSVEWAPSTLPNGVYFYRLTAAGFTQSRKMILMK